MKKKILSLLAVAAIVISLAPAALADGKTHITDSSDTRISSMLSAIEWQNFKGSGTNAEHAKQVINHVLYNSSFAVFSNGQFRYSNAGDYVSIISDGTYDVVIRPAKGCFALASYVTNLTYGYDAGTEGLKNEIGSQSHTADSLKNLLVTQAQCGEHIRIDEKHSVAFISADADGFYCIDYQDYEGCTAMLVYWTYSGFVKTYSAYEIGIYNANPAVNSGISARPDHKHDFVDGKCRICGYDLSNPFTDIDSSSLYFDAVMWMYAEGITTGYTATEYNTSGECTRGQVVAFLWREAGCPLTDGTCPYPDVSPQAYYYEAVIWANEHNIIKGYADGTFRPNNTVSRSQFVTFLWRMENEPKPQNNINPFTDVHAGDFYKAILWGNESGVVQGYGNGLFRPDDGCTRGHVALFMYRNFT